MTLRTRRGICGIAAFGLFAAMTVGYAGWRKGAADAGPMQLTDVTIPMRDGVHLHAVICAPKKQKEKLPILLTRTPYGTPTQKECEENVKGPRRELARDGYIFVIEDIRGRYKSEGVFVMMRPPGDKSAPKAVDESTDAWDTVDWLVKNVPNNNGRVGVYGISYPGWLTVMASIDPHPAIKAVSEQASPADMYLGDDFHHNGAFRLSYGFEYAFLLENSNTNYNFKFDRADTFDWYLRLGPLSNAERDYAKGKLPTWTDFTQHPNYDDYWKKRAVTTYFRKVTVPNLNVAGWWDQEDYYGPMTIYSTLEKQDDAHLNYLAVGPWNHGGWSHGTGRSLGQVEFGSDTSQYFREKVEAPWFAYWLKGKGTLPVAEAVTFRTGSNEWQSYDRWPPERGVSRRKLYFRECNALSFDPPPREGEVFDSYISDPFHPVPYRKRPVEPTYPDGGWPTWLVEDQRFVHQRPDVQSWETEPLQADLAVTGEIITHLFASTTGSDSDWIVKLVDVYPEDAPKMAGYQLMVADEVFRGRFRRNFENPEPIPPNEVQAYTVSLHFTDHTFQKGHRVMVQVQSTWFPLIDRNPQKFVSNIFEAKEEDFQTAVQRVYRSRRYPSSVELPVMAGAAR